MDVTELQSSAFSDLHETETVACTELADAIYLIKSCALLQANWAICVCFQLFDLSPCFER